jgi:sensor histidine kinase regulating citrate/malate metabolism
MKIKIETSILLLIVIILVCVLTLYYSRMSKYNKDNECDEEQQINKKQKSCCVKGKCHIKNI